MCTVVDQKTSDFCPIVPHFWGRGAGGFRPSANRQAGTSGEGTRPLSPSLCRNSLGVEEGVGREGGERGKTLYFWPGQIRCTYSPTSTVNQEGTRWNFTYLCAKTSKLFRSCLRRSRLCTVCYRGCSQRSQFSIKSNVRRHLVCARDRVCVTSCVGNERQYFLPFFDMTS